MDPPRTKRQKVSVACDPCRARKIKCNGIQPICEPCMRKNASSATCTWKSGIDRMSSQWTNGGQQSQFNHSLSPNSRSQPYQSGSELLRGRYRSSSDSIQRSVHSPNISQPSPSPSNKGRMSFVADSGERTHPSRDNAHGSEEVPSGHSVHAIIGATLDEDIGEGYFGTSSAGTFMQVSFPRDL